MSTSSIMFVAGDPSGDEHASHVIRRLAARLPGIQCIGIGGPAMQLQGFKSLMPFEGFNRMGVWEVLVHLPFFLKAKKRLIAAMEKHKPKALVCVDYPGLNIPLMQEARRRNIPVVWYIVPQVWAWKGKRAETLGRYASFIGVVFPFEVNFFTSYKAPVFFVGHPLVEAMEEAPRASITGIHTRNTDSSSGIFRLSLIPGSRPQEVSVILPTMIEAALQLKKQHPGLSITVSKCKGLPLSLFGRLRGSGEVAFHDGVLRDLLSRTDGAFVTSGTATLETALAKVPMVIVYRTSTITYSLMRRMIRIPFIGLPNIVAGEKIVPECIQSGASVQKLVEEMNTFIVSKDYYQSAVERLSRLKDLFGDKKPSMEMAEAIAALVDK